MKITLVKYGSIEIGNHFLARVSKAEYVKLDCYLVRRVGNYSSIMIGSNDFNVWKIINRPKRRRLGKH